MRMIPIRIIQRNLLALIESSRTFSSLPQANAGRETAGVIDAEGTEAEKLSELTYFDR
jgi:hypothetical protein